MSDLNDNLDQPAMNGEAKNSPGEVHGAAQKCHEELLEVLLDLIDKGPNIRKSNAFDPNNEEDQALTESVANGNEVPGRAFRKSDGRFELQYGFRRFDALTAAGRKTMKLIVTDEPLSPDELMEKQLLENCERRDMNAMDRADAYEALKAKYGTNKAVAEKLKHPERMVSEYLLLKSKYLSKESKIRVREGTLTFTEARDEARAKKGGKGKHKKGRTQRATDKGGKDENNTSKSSPGEVSPRPPKHPYKELTFTFRDANTRLVFVVGGDKKKQPPNETVILALESWVAELRPAVKNDG